MYISNNVQLCQRTENHIQVYCFISCCTDYKLCSFLIIQTITNNVCNLGY